jgi:hypothetical protein
MKKKFKDISKSNQKTDFNLQEKFVYYLEAGHALHVSEKNNKIIQNLIDEYLFVILDGDID